MTAKMGLYTKGGQSFLRMTRQGSTADPWDLDIGDYGDLVFDSANDNQVLATRTELHSYALFGNPPDTSPIFPRSPGLWPLGSTSGTNEQLYRTWFISGVRFFGNYELIERTQGATTPPIVTSYVVDEDGWGNAQAYVHQTYNWQGITYGYTVFPANLVTIARTHDFIYGQGERTPQPGNTQAGYSGFFVHHNSSFELDLLRDGAYSVSVNWGLPADDSPWPPPNGPATPGTEIAQISDQTVRVARGGYDAATATGDQLLIGGSGLPARAILAGETAVAAGATVSIPLPPDVDYPEALVADTIAWIAGTPVTHPPANYVFGFAAVFTMIHMRWRFDSGNLILRNDGPRDVNCRYIVFGFDDRPPTSGAAAVLTGIDDAQGGYFQVRRPGSAEPPRLADIYLDSRWPTLPVVAQGRWIIPGGGDTSNVVAPHQHQVSFANNGGWKPYPLFMVEYPEEIYQGAKAAFLINTSSSQWSQGAPARDCVYAAITDTSVVFNAFPRHPSNITRSGQNPPAYRYGRRPIAVRYYILAVPA